MEQAKQRFVILNEVKNLDTECQAETGIPRFSLALSLFYTIPLRYLMARYLSAARNDKSFGFTLVELAIALMVIGLLIGGVLKGQELIENTRITRVIKDIRDYETAVTIFRTTYNAKPSDMKHPDRRLPNCKTDPCQITGNGNGQIPNGSAQERINFWIHLQHAGLITYPSEQEFTVQNPSPLNAYGGHFMRPTGRTPRVYPWMNEPEGGMLYPLWKSGFQGIVPIVCNIMWSGCANTAGGS